MKRNKLIKELNKKWPELEAVKSEDFDGSENGIWFKGTESALIDGLPLMSDCEPNDTLDKYLQNNGFFAEPYDAGTLMAYDMGPKICE